MKKDIARNPNEANRVATPLELFFDLVYVVAIASAGVGLHNALQDQNIFDGIMWFILSFFTIYWCWLNFAWYASSYDNDDTFFRIVTFIQIFGALVMAVGISKFFEPKKELVLGLTGYVIMRFALVAHWIRASILDKARRKTCLRYGISIAFVQLLWVLAYNFLPKEQQLYYMFILFLFECAVPIFAEGDFKTQSTPWHPHHIAERYSLLVIIVLGEGIVGTTNTISSLVNIETRWQEAFPLGFAAAGLMFTLWWSYFKMPFGKILQQNKTTFIVPFMFGYGHFIIFASLAAVGVGLQIVADRAESLTTKEFQFSTVYALWCVAIPVSIYLMMMSLYRTIMIRRSRYNWLSWLVALFLPGIPVIANHFGFLLEWALWLLVIPPAAFIFLNNIDDCTNKHAKDFSIESS